MTYLGIPMASRKRVALIAHDNCKGELLDWARYNRDTLAQHELHATGTTERLLARELGLSIVCFLSGPLGGDQQVGAGIVEGRIDFVIFFWDPMEPQPHDVDVKALLRIAVVHNVPIARNRATDYLRQSRVQEELPSELPGGTPIEAETMAVLDVIRRLPEAYRDTLLMRLVEGMTGAEIAERSGLTPASVRVNLHRGMKLLREKLS